jgi:hypothetical protein
MKNWICPYIPRLIEESYSSQICTQFYRSHKTLPSPPLRLHPPNPRTLMQKPLLKQRPPPPPPVILSPLSPPHINPLIPRVYFHTVLRAFPLHPPKCHHQINIPRQIQRLRAAERGLKTQIDAWLVTLTQSCAGKVVIESLLIDAFVLTGQKGACRSFVRVGAHDVHNVCEYVELFC